MRDSGEVNEREREAKNLRYKRRGMEKRRGKKEKK